LPGLARFLDGIADFHFGGTCYSTNYYFNRLLVSLGYRAMLCGADMSNPDVHLVSVVSVEGREYLVDVGYAAPFVTPLPLGLTSDHVVEAGRDRYVLKPRDAEGRSRMELYRDGELKHGYVAKPVARQIEEFEGVIANSYRTDATFMNALLLARHAPGRSVVIHNLTVIESDGSSSRTQTLFDRSELVRAIADHFGIPPAITTDVVANLAMGDAWR
jgi:arylamine N-acetyltransferase